MDDKDRILDIIFEDLKEIKKDIKGLVSLKFKILGVVTVGSFIISLAVTTYFK